MCITSEAVNLLQNRSFGGNIALKIDIKKAFDTMDWDFPIHVLHPFGFNDTFCNWVKVIFILPSCLFLLMVMQWVISLVNEGCARGSPLLFCIAKDVLSRGISRLVETGQLFPMSGPRGCHTSSHVLYADDIMVFCKATKRNLLNLMSLFKAYGEASGHLISAAKCRFFSGGITPRSFLHLGHFRGTTPFYLFSGSYFQR